MDKLLELLTIQIQSDIADLDRRGKDISMAPTENNRIINSLSRRIQILREVRARLENVKDL